MDRCNDKINTKKCYIDPQQQIPVPYGSMLHIPPTNSLLVAAKQEPYETKSLSLHKKRKKKKKKGKILKGFYGKKFSRVDQQIEKER